MVTLVFDIPASSGGAATVLEYYYNKSKEDPTTQYIFVLGKYELSDAQNIHIIRYPWAKKTWIHRVFFDCFIAGKLVRKYRPDAILSLQNTMIKTSEKIPQTVYMHQSIPFAKIRFNLFRDPKYWVIQNIMGKFIIRSLKRCDRIIVQTEWIRRACAQKAGVPLDKFSVEQPEIVNHLNETDVYCDPGPGNRTLFYPANTNSFKNHIALIKALELYQKKHQQMPRVVFTVSRNMGNYAKPIMKEAKRRKVDIEFVGRIRYEEVKTYYRTSILAFPSRLETFGLPLLEAKLFNCPIICSDEPFAHEVLGDYSRVIYFKPDDIQAICNSIERVLAQ